MIQLRRKTDTFLDDWKHNPAGFDLHVSVFLIKFVKE